LTTVTKPPGRIQILLITGKNRNRRQKKSQTTHITCCIFRRSINQYIYNRCPERGFHNIESWFSRERRYLWPSSIIWMVLYHLPGAKFVAEIVVTIFRCFVMSFIVAKMADLNKCRYKVTYSVIVSSML
jgi:hypothetical protein